MFPRHTASHVVCMTTAERGKVLNAHMFCLMLPCPCMCHSTLRAASLFHSPHQFHRDFALVSHGFAVISHDFAVILRVVSQCFCGGFAGFAVISHDFAVASRVVSQ